MQAEANLGLETSALYGWDTVGLGTTSSDGPTLKNTTVAAYAVNDFYVGIFGLDPKPTNWSSFLSSSPSYMSLLVEQDIIPSLSFGYTAGAKYRDDGVTGSLTLGGYDESRFVPNDVQFPFGTDNARQTILSLQSITTPANGNTGAPVQLLPEALYTLLDTTIAEMWLPLAACQAFEKQFGLVYDPTTELYLVNNALHTTLLARNASITLSLGLSESGGKTVNITLPYAATDLVAKAPYAGLNTSALYYPLRRATNETQYTLGRAFMQEAYVSVDYARATFNVSQVLWGSSAKSSMIAIPPPSDEDTGTTIIQTGGNGVTPLSGPAIAGIAVGTILALALIGALMIWYFRRRVIKKRAVSAVMTQHEKKRPMSGSSMASGDSRTIYCAGDRPMTYQKWTHDSRSPVSEDKLLSPCPVSSIGSPQTPWSGQSRTNFYSFDCKTALSSPDQAAGIWAGEKDGGQVYEMPGSSPTIVQADGKEITKADMIKYQERMSPLGEKTNAWPKDTKSVVSPLQERPSPLSERPSPLSKVMERTDLRSVTTQGLDRRQDRRPHLSYGYGDDEEYQSPAF